MSDHTIKARALEVKLKETEAKVSDAQLQIKELEETYSSSKRSLLEHEEKVKSLKMEVGELGGKLKAAEQNPVISPEVSGKIIEDYKAFKDFVREVIKGSTDAFSNGFGYAKVKYKVYFLTLTLAA